MPILPAAVLTFTFLPGLSWEGPQAASSFFSESQPARRALHLLLDLGTTMLSSAPGGSNTTCAEDACPCPVLKFQAWPDIVAWTWHSQPSKCSKRN